ncbi:hypothetical protein FIBSPDRAFT_47068 [Athelia psychrophila]|uniref:Uncharacterized protein n=1 Tax=Athelia psychrophila TaxID=1759441 RepID=A0A166U511_9AGAM|nr:hypothetical protein FIBSPDRAFT_47068 [Fibularhizoctonia sp. CBS 109695]
MSINLKLYLLNTALPEMRLGAGSPRMPQAGHKSHTNSLTIMSESSRKLHGIYQMRSDIYEETVATWIERNIPETPVEIKDKYSGYRLTVPDYQAIMPVSFRSPSSTAEISALLEQLPLATAQRALHAAYPETKTFRFVRSVEADIDEQIFQHFEWKDARQSNSSARLIVAVQPPWVLSPQDLKSFSECPTVPLNKTRRSFALVSKHRLWSKMWDLCARKDCRYFVLTTFHGWVFGAFSEGWTTAYVSPIINWHDAEISSALQSLVHWTASAMGIPGGWSTPQMYETVRDLGTRPVVPAPYRTKISHARSESSSDGEDDASGHPQSYQVHPQLQAANIRRWAESTQAYSSTQTYSTQLYPPTPPSPTGSTGSNWSETTARGRANADATYRGDWVTMPPVGRRAAAY